MATRCTKHPAYPVFGKGPHPKWWIINCLTYLQWPIRQVESMTFKLHDILFTSVSRLPFIGCCSIGYIMAWPLSWEVMDDIRSWTLRQSSYGPISTHGEETEGYIDHQYYHHNCPLDDPRLMGTSILFVGETVTSLALYRKIWEAWYVYEWHSELAITTIIFSF